MPRKPRLFLPNQPQHVVVRGHNRDPVLARHEDFRFLYRCLLDASKNYRLNIHAWVFMHNHLHMLVTPENEWSLPRTMQSVGRRYAQYFNRIYHRSGSLWEGRYKAAFVDTERYLLGCYRYIEMNPVRAGIVCRPEEYPYSSFHANALGREDKLVTPHGVYLALIGAAGMGVGSADSEENWKGYRKLFEEQLTQRELTTIRRGTHKELGIGQAEFLLRIAKLLES